MAFFPASCDSICKGCEKNMSGWCIWKDRATPDYQTISFKAESKYDLGFTERNVSPLD